MHPDWGVDRVDQNPQKEVSQEVRKEIRQEVGQEVGQEKREEMRQEMLKKMLKKSLIKQLNESLSRSIIIILNKENQEITTKDNKILIPLTPPQQWQITPTNVHNIKLNVKQGQSYSLNLWEKELTVVFVL